MDYKSAGVNIDKADKLIDRVKAAARLTYTPGVLSGVGGFGSLFEIGKYKNPVLVSGTDGVGTKIMIARETGKLSVLGFDLVAMCVDDIICSGAKPLFFIDYLAMGELEENSYMTLVESIAAACRFSRCALIGGETAELPGMYPKGEFDLAGFAVGVVEKEDILTPAMIKEGDKVIGLASSGFHSNGYSLVRKVLTDKKLDLTANYGFGHLKDLLLAPTEIYAPVLNHALSLFKKNIHGIAHITGGGIPGNLNRVLPENMDAIVDKSSWHIPDLINFIVEQGGISEEEKYKVFNMGIGMTVVVDGAKADEILDFFCKESYKAFLIGEISSGKGEVQLR